MRSSKVNSRPLSAKGAGKILPLLFGLLPLLYDSDLYSFSLLPKLVLLQIAALAMAVFWAYGVTRGQIGWRVPNTFLPAVCFTLLSGISAYFADYSVFEGTAFLSKQATFFFLFFVISQTADAGIVERVLLAVCGAGIVVSLIGISEFWGIDLVDIPSNGRPSSTFAYRNFAATYLIAALPIAMAVTLRAQKTGEYVLGLAASVLMVLFLVYTRSRGAWLGMLVGTAFTVVLMLKLRTSICVPRTIVESRRGRFLLAAGFVLFLAMAPWRPQVSAPHSRAIDENKSGLLDAMGSLTTSGASRGRWTLWSGTISMIQESPLLGVGPDNWKLAYPAYDTGQMIQVGSAPERPHNDYLWITSESGIVALGFYLWFLAAALRSAIAGIRRQDKYALIAAAVACGLVSAWIHALFSFPRERVEASLFLWCGPAFLHLLSGPRPGRVVPKAVVPILLPAIAAACLAITVLEMRFDRALLKGLQSLAAGDTVSLTRHTSEGLAAGPFDNRIYLLQNKVFQSQRNYKRAQQACLTGLSYHPNSPELLGDLGMVYAMDGNLEAAEQALLKSIALAPSHHQAYNNLGGVYQKQGAFDEAHKAYTQAVSTKPDYVDALSNLGLLNIIRGDYDEAVGSFNTALVSAGSDPILHHNLADALYVRDRPGDRTSAARHYHVFLRSWRGDPAESELARSRAEEIEQTP